MILVVDALAANRTAIAAWLEQAGHKVTQAATGAQALSAVRTLQPDLILLDIDLPDIDGFTVCERIKGDPATEAIPVVHLTATAVEATDRTQGLDRGADAYLTGPIEPEVLLATVHAVLRYARARQEERRLALTLQEALLPDALPEVPGVDLAARYVPATAHTEVGGDFYEVLPLGDRLLVAIGDVMGHSPHAAVVMGEIRHALRAYAFEGHPVGHVLGHINRLLIHFHPAEMATVSLLSLDPVTGDVRAANAGHLPPLLVAGGQADYVPLPGPLLGGDLRRPEDTTMWIPPGGTLVLVTDGLVERRGESLEAGLERLRELSAHVDDDLEAYCDRILSALMPLDHEDDVALVVLRRGSP
ncbi:fused response regulator/phosphatase [Streptosporangiaceae bacterium NEAU-GS5]|nr:fused response regulator/phosphatase [Streptosporangiaceae bacterium NEAU-GS5]